MEPLEFVILGNKSELVALFLQAMGCLLTYIPSLGERETRLLDVQSVVSLSSAGGRRFFLSSPLVPSSTTTMPGPPPARQNLYPVTPIAYNDIIERLVSIDVAAGKTLFKLFTHEEIYFICTRVRQVFLEQPAMIEINPPVKICGDIHRQFNDLLRLFKVSGFPPTANYLFLGDYVDRGRQQLETILFLFGYKLRYPKNFFLLRGNHEESRTNKDNGFAQHCIMRTGNLCMWNMFNDVFSVMPITGLVGGRILCMHGGISPKLRSLNQLRRMERRIPMFNPDALEFGLVWSDPADCTGFRLGKRGESGLVFGADELDKCLKTLGIDMIARGHQVVMGGYEFFHGRKLVTIFSAAHYESDKRNSAGVMVVDKNMKCSFEVCKPDLTEQIRIQEAKKAKKAKKKASKSTEESQ